MGLIIYNYGFWEIKTDFVCRPPSTVLGTINTISLSLPCPLSELNVPIQEPGLNNSVGLARGELYVGRVLPTFHICCCYLFSFNILSF